MHPPLQPGHELPAISIPLDRRARKNIDEEWDQEPAALGQRLAEAVQEDGNDRDLWSPLRQVGDPGLEGLEALGFTAGAFGKKDQDFTPVEGFDEWAQRIRTGRRAPWQRNDADDAGREPGEPAA